MATSQFPAASYNFIRQIRLASALSKALFVLPLYQISSLQISLCLSFREM